jgi:hypothetical protein
MGCGAPSMVFSLRTDIFPKIGFVRSRGGIFYQERKLMTQETFVLTLLRAGVAITPAKALAEYNIWRLADVIYKLRYKGYNIRCTIKKSFSGKRYAEYTLA